MATSCIHVMIFTPEKKKQPYKSLTPAGYVAVYLKKLASIARPPFFGGRPFLYIFSGKRKASKKSVAFQPKRGGNLARESNGKIIFPEIMGHGFVKAML